MPAQMTHHRNRPSSRDELLQIRPQQPRASSDRLHNRQVASVPPAVRDGFGILLRGFDKYSHPERPPARSKSKYALHAVNSARDQLIGRAEYIVSLALSRSSSF